MSELCINEFLFRDSRKRNSDRTAGLSREGMTRGALIVCVDGLPLRLNSARGDCREWSTLDRIGQWMVDNGFRYWWTRNDLEYVESPLPADALTAPAAGIAAESSLGMDAELPINPDADSYVI